MKVYEDSRTIKKPYLRTMDISGDVLDCMPMNIRVNVIVEVL